MFGLRAHINVTTCDIYGTRILFSLPMLWESALLSLLVSFTQSELGSHSLDSIRRFGATPIDCVVSQEFYPRSRTADPILILGRPRVLWHLLLWPTVFLRLQ